MNYGELINKSFKTVWKNKVIWLFGILFTLFGGSGGGGNFNFGGNFGGGSTESGPSMDRAFQDFPQQALTYIETHHLWPLIIAGAILLVSLALIAIFMNAVIRGSLIGLVKKVDEGGETRVKEGFAIGFRNALPILFRSILVGLVTLVAVGIPIAIDVLLFIWAFLHKPDPSIPLIILAVILALIIIIFVVAVAITSGLVNTFADRLIVLEKRRIIDSIKRAIAFIRANAGNVAMSWLIMVGLGIAAGIVLAIPIIIGVALVAVIVVATANIVVGLAIAIPLLLLLLIPIGFIEAYSSTYWTYVYLALAKEESPQPQEFTGEGLATTE